MKARISGFFTSAKLKLYVTDSSSAPREIKVVSGSWTESTVTYRNCPRLDPNWYSLVDPVFL